MTNPVHLLSVASLLLVAFLVGAIIGTLARLIAARVGQRPEAAPTIGPVEARAEAAPLVSAPRIAPLPVAPAPTPPPASEVPVPDFAATLIALAGDTPPAAFIEATKARTGPAAIPVAASEEASRAVMQPAHVAGETTSGVHVAAPRHDAPSAAAEVEAKPVEQRTAEVIRFPTATVEIVSEQPADIVVGGETVAVVDTAELTPSTADEASPIEAAEPVSRSPEPQAMPAPAAIHEDRFTFVGTQEQSATAADAVTSSVSPVDTGDATPVPPVSASAAVGEIEHNSLTSPEVVEVIATSEPMTPPVASSEDTPSAPTEATVDPAPEPDAKVTPGDPVPPTSPAVEPPQSPDEEPVAAKVGEPENAQPPRSDEPASPPAEPVDEDAAMRAIEGNWSPSRRSARRPARKVPAPEGANQAVAASARAVTAARRTAESVVAEVAGVKAEAGRPSGLDGPRNGRKDDLTHIIGVLPVIETALNKLGIYHFDQVGSLTDENVGWIERHLGVPGRVGRELWREQARELSAVLQPKRAAEH